MLVESRLLFDTVQTFYGGVYGFGPNECSSKTVNHAVTLVGYGEEDGKKYWLILNRLARIIYIPVPFAR